MSGIIDIHAHAFPEAIARRAVNQIGDHYAIPMYGNGTLQDLLECSDKAGVDYVVIHSTATKANQVKAINDWVADNSGGKLIGFGTLHPDMDNAEEEFERIVALGLKGIKLHPDFQGFNADAPKLDKIYRIIGNHLPVLIHAGDEKLDCSSPKRLAHVIDKFPELTIIAAHLGGHKRWQEALSFLIGKNLYLDTSSAIPYMDASFATMLIKMHGTDRVVFGTDYPAAYPSDALKDFFKLGLTDQEREDILYNNAAKLLNIDS